MLATTAGVEDSKYEIKSAAPGLPACGPPPQYYPGSNLLLTSLFGWDAVSQAEMAALTMDQKSQS